MPAIVAYVQILNRERGWGLDTFCICITLIKFSRKKFSTNELELLAVVWSVDRFKHYILGKEFIKAAEHKALTSALDKNGSNKTWQSRPTRLVDRPLPYQFKVR